MTQSPSLPELPKLPEPYTVASTMKCVACGALYEPMRSLAPYAAGNPFACVPTHSCKCGSTTFGGAVSYDSPSPAKFTAAHLRDFATTHGLACYEAGRASRAQSEWISVEDTRKPVGRTPILVAVQWMNHYEHEDGTPARQEGYDVTEGEYVPQHGERAGYFDSYAAPYDHDSWGITHWMPLPAAPTQGAEGAAPQAVVGEASDEEFGIGDEVILTRAVSVMNDVLTDISGWEDRELAEAVESSKVDLCAMIECIRMRADGSYVPGTKPIDGEVFTPSPTPTAPQAADALREALKGLLTMLPSDHEDRPGEERIPASYCYVRWAEIREARAALAQHQPATLGEAKS